MSHDLGVDVWEVIDAASTKPFGFMPFYPGPGLGGHCIPIDPYYLSWKARQNGFESRFIELAGHVNSGMPRFLVARVIEVLSLDRKPLRDARVHLFGIAYKPGVGDVRESPAIDIARLLQRGGAIVSYSDPHVPAVEQGQVVLEEVSCEIAPRTGLRLRGHHNKPPRVRLRGDREQGAAHRRHAVRAQGVLRCPYLPALGARGETPRGTETGDARVWQGATREQIGSL